MKVNTQTQMFEIVILTFVFTAIWNIAYSEIFNVILVIKDKILSFIDLKNKFEVCNLQV